MDDIYFNIGKKSFEISNALAGVFGIQSSISNPLPRPNSGSIAGIPSSFTIQSPALPPTYMPTVFTAGPNLVPAGNFTSLIIS